MQRSYSAL